MFDGSALPLKENLGIAVKLLERCKKSDVILEIEVEVVGGEEDGVRASAAAKLYTTPEDTLEVARRLKVVPGARATCSPRRSATCTASTNRARSS
jgi:fructose-bisphosphate aldolase class II